MKTLKKAFFFILAFFCGLIAFGGVLSLSNYSGQYRSEFQKTDLFLILFFVVLMVFFIRCAIKVSSSSTKKSEETIQSSLEEKLKQVDSMKTLSLVDSPRSIILKPNEECYFQVEAKTLIVKNKVVGRTGGYRGASVRIAKGFTVHTGGSRGQSIRQDVSSYFPGLFTITNQRIIMTGEKGFDLPLQKLTSLTPYSDGVSLQFGKSTYTVLMDEPYWVQKIIHLIQSGAPVENNSVEETVSIPSPEISAISIADEIKKLKELLDIGAITQEEFDEQKQKLLGRTK